MKKTIMALVASTFIAGVAHAAPAPVTFTGHATTGAECSAQFDEIGGINVKELSERKQCLAVVHDIDTMFTHKTFWVRTGNQFVAFDVEEIAKMSRSERAEVIKNTVIKEVVREVIVEKIVVDEERVTELEAEVKALEAAKSALEMAYGEQSEAVAAITANLMTAEVALEEALESVETLAETIEMLNEAHEVAITAAQDQTEVVRDMLIGEQDAHEITMGELASARADVTRLEGELATSQALHAQAVQAANDANDRYGAEAQAHINTSIRLGLLIEDINADKVAAEMRVAELQAELETSVTDALFVGNTVVDGVRIGEGGIAASLGYTGAADIASLIQHVEDIGYNVETVAWSLVDAGLYGNVETATAAILDGSAEFAIGMALVQAYIDGQMSVNVPVAPDNIEERIEQGIENRGLPVRLTAAEAVAAFNEAGAPYGISTTTEELFDYVARSSNADSVAFISEATGIDFFNVNYGRDADGNALVFAEYTSAVDVHNSNDTFIGYDVTFRTSVGEIVIDVNTRHLTYLNDGKYTDGFERGFEEGFQRGYNTGYNDGYNDGFRDGYSQGFQDGVDSVS